MVRRRIRKLDGFYFRQRDLESGKWENRCFSDMKENEMEKVIKNHDSKVLAGMFLQLAQNVQTLSNTCPVSNEELTHVLTEQFTQPDMLKMCIGIGTFLRAVGDRFDIINGTDDETE